MTTLTFNRFRKTFYVWDVTGSFCMYGALDRSLYTKGFPYCSYKRRRDQYCWGLTFVVFTVIVTLPV